MTKKRTRCRAADLIFEHSITEEPNMDNSHRTEQVQDDISFSLGYETPGTPDLIEDESTINCNFTSPRKIDSSADFSRYSSTDEISSLESDTADESSLDSDLENLTAINRLVLDGSNNSNFETNNSLSSDNSCDDSLDSTTSNNFNDPNEDTKFDNLVNTELIETNSVDQEETENIPDLLGEAEFIEEFDIGTDNGKGNLNNIISKNIPLNQDNLVNDYKIGCYNIQNQFDHMTAGELFIKGGFSFLSFQEPYSSHTRSEKSWESYMKGELESARIISLFSKYQVLMLDDDKWGGKIAEEFQQYQNGRVISLALRLNDKEHVGTISVYAVTSSSNENSNNKGNKKKRKTRDKTTKIIKEIMDRWDSKFKCICPIVMGDIQETVSKEDRDNRGSFRRDPFTNGIIKLTDNSHYSVVRNKQNNIPYWTREGRMGSRGIDHILYPKNHIFASWINDAYMDRMIGERYFPSDHILLACHIKRHTKNTKALSRTRIKQCYCRIAQIKIKYDEEDNRVEFDEGQFLTRSAKEQQDLFKEIQEKTDPNSNKKVKTFMEDINSKIELSNRLIWMEKKLQDRKGTKNDLIEFEEEEFLDLESIANDFSKGARNVMEELKLSINLDIDKETKVKRTRIAAGKGFKLFDSLPIPTKIRYTKFIIRKKIRELKAILRLTNRKFRSPSQDNAETRNNQASQYDMFNDKTSNLCYISAQLDRALKKGLFRNNSDTIFGMIEEEKAEWLQHIDAIEFHKSNSHLNSKINDKTIGSSFHLTDTKILNEVNTALSKSNCDQHIKIEDMDFSQADCLKKENDNWKDPIFRSKNLIEFAEEHREGDGLWIDMATDYISEAIDMLDKTDSKIINLQKWYKNNKMVYYAKINKPGNLSRKLIPLARDTPKTHTEIWDEDENCFRKCRSVEEELTATERYHGDWMDNSKAKENCAFAKIKFAGKGGARGVELLGDRVVKNKDVRKLIAKGKKGLTKEIRNAFVKAHNNKKIANLFKDPKIDNDLFNFPFFRWKKKGV